MKKNNGAWRFNLAHSVARKENKLALSSFCSLFTRVENSMPISVKFSGP